MTDTPDTATSVREAVRRALDEAETHSDLVRALMPIAYPPHGPDLPRELAFELQRQGVHPSDVSEWKRAGQNRYEVRLSPGHRLVHITIARDPDAGRYWGD